MKLGAILLRLRKKQRLSQAEVADYMGVSQSTYCAWESEYSSCQVPFPCSSALANLTWPGTYLKVLLTVLLISYVSLSCQQPDHSLIVNEQGVVTRLPHLWKSSISLDGGFTTTMHARHIYQQRYLLTAQRTAPLPTADNLCFKDLETGQNHWVWSDRFQPNEGATIFQYSIYAHQNLLLYNYGPRAYCIDQETGQTRWRKQWPLGISRVITTTGYGPHFYFTGTPAELRQQDRLEEYVYQGDMLTGEIRPLAKLATLPGQVIHDPSGVDLHAIGHHLSVFTHQSDTLLLVSYSLPDPRPEFAADLSGYLSLYNLSQRHWVYEQKPLVNQDESGVGGSAVIQGDKVFFQILRWVGCFDLFTGQRRWMQRVTPAGFISDLILVEGKLLANGMNATLYCLDPQTGNVLWTQKSSGIASRLHYQDGVVYYIASQDLLAVEVATGKLLWQLQCPDVYTENQPQSWFMGFVTGLPAQGSQKGRIFASTNLNVYCFEAASVGK
ncbi:hypothetical protein GCM10027275_40010 [Rhabdobacter roseus]|uniref:Outer membrane protein assembly factor BamB n=1 Tax=Rhabdobacter roseus TaxID=1655419 RepID=A0A840TZW6_9BACT|nr:PQQ-binding-like beta-propeller repeat protein [Rhabdobacter roseus]MBB5285708.1 outer membrane protein assembly factor BamB [Rhabdobacter roseus]